MTKSLIFISIVTGGMVLVLQSTTSAFAQASSSAAPPPSAAAQRSAADLEKLVAPIALYPDPLIATILPASAYPLEIVEAARFVKDTNNIAKLDQQTWDDNVKAVARIPDVINKMNDDIAWTSDLGQAFVDQQKEVMDTIQSLRAKAQSAGTLKTTPQQVVVVTNTVVEKTIEQKVVVVTNTVVQIQPSDPQVVYVPTYDPAYVYAPPPGPPPIVTFAAGVAVGAIIANNCDWHGGGVYIGGGGYHGDVDINVNRNVNINNNVNANRNVNNASAQGQKWQPDQTRLHSSGAPAATKSSASRGWSNPSAGPASTAASASAKTAPSGTRSPSSQGTDRSALSSPSVQDSGTRGSAPSAARSSGGSSAGSGGGSHESAFSKTGNAGGDLAAGQRGSASRGSGASRGRGR